MTGRRAFAWAVVATLWFVLAATYSVGDALAAAAVAFIVVALLARAGGRAPLHARIRVVWLVRIARLPWQVLQDLGVLARRLRSPARRGTFRSVPFDVGDTAPLAVGRRALLTAAASLGPNTFIVDWDLDAQRVVVHQLERNARVLPAEHGTVP